MITIVYEDYPIEKKRKVYRTDKVYETIRVENKHVCSRCGGSMVGRPSWHWLCYSCWTEVHYGYKSGHGRWYGSESPKHERKEIKGWVEKKVEDFETYYENGQRIAVIPDKNFPVNNQVFYKEFNSLSYFIELTKTIKTDLFDQSKMEELDYWLNAKSKDEVYDRIQNIQIKQLKFKLDKMPHVTINEKRVKKEFNDMVGYYPNVPAFIQGNPLSMFNRKTSVIFSPVVEVNYDLTIDSTISKEQYKNKGLAFYSLLEHFFSKRIEVHLNLHCLMFSEDQVLHVRFKLSINQWNKDKILLFFVLTDVSFFRVLCLNYVNSLDELENHWQTGFGFTIKEIDARKFLKLNKYSMFLTNPNDMEIIGTNEQEDAHNFLKKLGLVV